MKKTKVKFLGKENDNFKIKFPYLKVPVFVNEYYYNKMRSSGDYIFTNL
ncbi:hypothetical protein EV195_106168 [Tenacibaculum skagerrakense]|uniref:Uncharacterized protein n=1 Tax=Tenacibaculum skagerrakense TaxID=186571 RepID=A0A4R2NR86_9FLAO|nr:hypothetical protein [Tenacibaculum skagerrakense]TCP24360.1 hypothetical protein EV195_106168 [Tenacibaculum skagerrakense]